MDISKFPATIIKERITSGAVFVMNMTKEDRIVPKHGDNKLEIFVIVALDDKQILGASLIINSKINDRLFNKIGMFQHLIKASEYNFLRHNSYIDCFNLHEFRIERIIQEADFLGRIENWDIQECITLLNSTNNIKPYTLKKYNIIK